MKVIRPKYLMLNGKNAFPNVTYEDFLIDVINFSQYFSTKHSFMEHFIVAQLSRQKSEIFIMN